MSKDTNDFQNSTENMKSKNSTNLKANKKKKPKKKKSIAFKIILSLIVIIVVLIGVGYFALNQAVGSLDNVDLNKDKLGISSDDELSKYKDYQKILNIALFGVDSTDGEATGRSDATMVATIDPVHNKLKITSFMRDSYVAIDDHGRDKLNHAYAFGGPELSINTLNQNFGLNVQEFASVDFSSLPQMIDALGGIELTINEDELEFINGYIYHLNVINNTLSPDIHSAGTQHVDGTQALAYTRIRYTDGGDFERTHRQRVVLSALFEKALKLPPSQYLSTINKISPYIKTSLSTADILSIGSKVATMGLSGVTLEQERFPLNNFCEGANIDGIYYLAFDTEQTKEQVRNYIFNDILPDESDVVEPYSYSNDTILNSNSSSYESTTDSSYNNQYYNSSSNYNSVDNTTEESYNYESDNSSSTENSYDSSNTNTNSTTTSTNNYYNNTNNNSSNNNTTNTNDDAWSNSSNNNTTNTNDNAWSNSTNDSSNDSDSSANTNQTDANNSSNDEDIQ